MFDVYPDIQNFFFLNLWSNSQEENLASKIFLFLWGCNSSIMSQGKSAKSVCPCSTLSSGFQVHNSLCEFSNKRKKE